MACNECNDYVNPCTECNDHCPDGDNSCNCIQKDMSTDCIVYTGDDLECSGIKQNTILTTVIQNLDAFICNLRDEIYAYIVQATTLLNIGGGAEIFKQANGLGNKELRTIVSEDTAHLDIVQNVDTIGVRAGVHRLELDSGTDILSLIVNTVTAGDTTLSTIDLSEFNYDTFVQSASFSTVNQILTIVRNNGEPDINVDLSFLDNHVISGLYAANNIALTLTDSSVVNIDVSLLVNEILVAAAAANLQADVLETNTSSKAYIQNKNPHKTVVLGVAGNYNVLDADNNYVIEIDNGANDVTIDFSTITITNNYFVGFVQKGTGLVTFNNADVIPQDLTNEIYGQGHVAGMEIIAATKYLAGTLNAL